MNILLGHSLLLWFKIMIKLLFHITIYNTSLHFWKCTLSHEPLGIKPKKRRRIFLSLAQSHLEAYISPFSNLQYVYTKGRNVMLKRLEFQIQF